MILVILIPTIFTTAPYPQPARLRQPPPAPARPCQHEALALRRVAPPPPPARGCSVRRPDLFRTGVGESGDPHPERHRRVRCLGLQPGQGPLHGRNQRLWWWVYLGGPEQQHHLHQQHLRLLYGARISGSKNGNCVHFFCLFVVFFFNLWCVPHISWFYESLFFIIYLLMWMLSTDVWTANLSIASVVTTCS